MESGSLYTTVHFWFSVTPGGSQHRTCPGTEYSQGGCESGEELRVTSLVTFACDMTLFLLDRSCLSPRDPPSQPDITRSSSEKRTKLLTQHVSFFFSFTIFSVSVQITLNRYFPTWEFRSLRFIFWYFKGSSEGRSYFLSVWVLRAITRCSDATGSGRDTPVRLLPTRAAQRCSHEEGWRDRHCVSSGARGRASPGQSHD